MDTTMAEPRSSTHVNPDIFKHLQEKIDEEGKVRDVLRLDMFNVHATNTDLAVGAQRNCPDP
jgi:hypothetical protein